MEACGSSQDWARKLEAMGHEVHLMSPKAVKPFVSGQKNDHNDAIGIYKAMFNGVRRVPVKSTEIRDLQTLKNPLPSNERQGQGNQSCPRSSS